MKKNREQIDKDNIIFLIEFYNSLSEEKKDTFIKLLYSLKKVLVENKTPPPAP